MLRNSRQDLFEALSTEGFLPEDFIITEEQLSPENFKLIISLKSDPRLIFDIKVKLDENMSFEEKELVCDIKCRVTPGNYFDTEPLRLNNPRQMFREIEEWVERAHTELRAMPIIREIEKQQKEIEEIIQGFKKEGGHSFTEDEISEWEKRLDQLEKKLADNIKKVESVETKAEKKIERIHEDIEFLKKRLSDLDKPGWKRTFLVRVTHWLKDPINQQLLKSGRAIAENMLLGSGDSPE